MRKSRSMKILAQNVMYKQINISLIKQFLILQVIFEWVECLCCIFGVRDLRHSRQVYTFFLEDKLYTRVYIKLDISQWRKILSMNAVQSKCYEEFY